MTGSERQRERKYQVLEIECFVIPIYHTYRSIFSVIVFLLLFIWYMLAFCNCIFKWVICVQCKRITASTRKKWKRNKSRIININECFMIIHKKVRKRDFRMFHRRRKTKPKIKTNKYRKNKMKMYLSIKSSFRAVYY